MKPIETLKARQKKMQDVVKDIKLATVEKIQLPLKKGDKSTSNIHAR
jgi:hypothetical protein